METSLLSYNSTTIFPALVLNAPSVAFTNLFSFIPLIANDGVIKDGRKIKGTVRCYISKSSAVNPTMQYRLNVGGNFITLPQFTMPGSAFAVPTHVLIFDFTIQKIDSLNAIVYLEVKRINGTGILNNLFVLPLATVPINFTINNTISLEGRIVAAGAGVVVTTSVRQTELFVE